MQEDDDRRDVQSHEALVKARLDESGLRCRDTDEFVYHVRHSSTGTETLLFPGGRRQAETGLQN